MEIARNKSIVVQPRTIGIALVGMVWLSAATISAQERTEAEIEALRAAKTRATTTFLDASRSTAERLRAADGLGYPEEETFNALLRVGRDANEPDAVRIVALKKARYDQAYIDTLLAIIADPTESGELSSEMIYQISQRTTFRQSAELRQRIQGAFRDRLDDPRDAVRLAAYRAAVSSQDLQAIDRLVQSLRDTRTAPIPLAEAIELLDVDGPSKHLETVRPFLQHPDPEVRAQAARVMAVDQGSEQTVVDLALAAGTPREVRLDALHALAREDEQYMSYALRLMANRAEDADVVYAAMEGGMVRLNYHNEPPESQVRFADAVQGLTRRSGVVTSDGKDVGAEAKRLIAHLSRYFPAIKKHLASG